MNANRILLSMATCAGLLFLAGCAQSEHARVLASDLSGIDMIQLERQSTSAPRTVEDATTQVAIAPTTQSLAPQTRPAGSTSVQLTLDDVRAAALANNLDLQVELVNPEIARQFVDIERAKFEATFIGSGAFARTDVTGAGTDVQRYSAGIVVPMRTGGTITVDAPFNRTDNDTTQFDAGARFSISQPLLRNAGVSVNETSIRIAEYQKQIVDSHTKLQAIRILANADRAYWALYAARGALEVNQAQKRFAADASPRIEITRAESGAAARLEGILVAQTVVRHRERDLKRILNRPDLPLDVPTELVPVTPPTPVSLSLSAQALATQAVANRMEMLELELRLALDDESIRFERNQALPLFTLDYDYFLFRSGDRFREALGLAGGDDSADWSIALRAEIPIGNAAAKARVHRAILERAQRLGTKQQRSLAITQEVFDAVDQLTQDWQRILASRNESILAGRTYEAEQRQFDLGVRTSTDVLDASVRLATAQLREVQAIADYEISRVDIAFATGTLLGHERVIIPPYRH